MSRLARTNIVWIMVTLLILFGRCGWSGGLWRGSYRRKSLIKLSPVRQSYNPDHVVGNLDPFYTLFEEFTTLENSKCSKIVVCTPQGFTQVTWTYERSWHRQHVHLCCLWVFVAVAAMKHGIVSMGTARRPSLEPLQSDFIVPAELMSLMSYML